MIIQKNQRNVNFRKLKLTRRNIVRFSSLKLDQFWGLNSNIQALKGQCNEIFCFWFFWWISFPPAQEYCIRTVSNFFENLRRYSQVKMHHRYQRHRWQICHRCQRHRRQNCCRYQLHRRQIFPPISLVLLIPVANLPPVSTIPAANNG